MNVSLLCTNTYQENDGNVQQEGTESVQEEGEESDVVDLFHADLGNFPYEGNSQVHDSTDGSEVVDRHEGVHLEVGRAEQALDHGEPQGLEDDTTNLVNDTDPNELNLSHRGNNDTDNDDRDVKENLEVGLGDTEGPSRQQNGDGCGGL